MDKNKTNTLMSDAANITPEVDPNKGAGLFLLELVPDDWEMPEDPKQENFYIQTLKATDHPEEYPILMEDFENHVGTFVPDPNADSIKQRMNRDNYTAEVHSAMLGWHETCHILRTTFTWIVRDNAGKYRGAILMLPSKKLAHDAEVYLWWVRAGQDNSDGLEEEVWEFVQKWVRDEFPFENEAWPGRRTSWDEWKALPGGRTYGSR